MPRISSFYGLKIFMYGNEHNPPHFHAVYNEYEAIVEICDNPKVIQGELPSRGRKLVLEWAKVNVLSLRENSRRSMAGELLLKIPGLE